MATVSKYRKANPRDRLLGPSSTTFTFSMVPNLLKALWRSASVVLKLRPNTPMQLVGAGFSRSPLVSDGLGWALLPLSSGLLDLLDPDLLRREREYR